MVDKKWQAEYRAFEAQFTECPLCGRSKDICDGDCSCPECKGNGFDGYCAECWMCDGTGILITDQEGGA